MLDCCHSNHSRIHLSLCYGSFNSDCRPIAINDCLFSSPELVKSSYSKIDGQQQKHNACQEIRNGSEMLSPRNVWNVVPAGGSTVQMSQLHSWWWIDVRLMRNLTNVTFTQKIIDEHGNEVRCTCGTGCKIAFSSILSVSFEITRINKRIGFLYCIP